MKNLSLGVLMLSAFALVSPAANAAACPYAFKLRGSGIDKLWKETTNSAWKNMLPSGWTDNGFHFYSRVRERGPEAGINTPSDLESEIMKKVRDEAATPPADRRAIVLPIKSSSGANLRVFYDYDGRKSSSCELVTISY